MGDLHDYADKCEQHISALIDENIKLRHLIDELADQIKDYISANYFIMGKEYLAKKDIDNFTDSLDTKLTEIGD